MNTSAVQHYSYDKFCYPLNKDELQLSIQTGNDITAVFLIFGDPFDFKFDGKDWEWQKTRVPMEDIKRLSDSIFWSVSVRPFFKRCKYFFEIHSCDEKKFFFEDGFYSEGQTDLQKNASPFMFPWMNEADIIKPASWAENTVWYQIFPARFCRSSSSAKEDYLPWAASDHAVTNEERYGGNIAGITEKLDYLEDLGINGLYLNPINLSVSQHKYDTKDYLQIDPDFGSEEDLIHMVKEAHRHSMHVMLDGVFNHSGWEFFAWQDLIQKREKSRYASWFMVNDYNFLPKPCDNAAKGFYYSFAFSDRMPKLNTNNPEVRDYFCSVCETWVKKYDIDAIRLDVANEISHAFCRELRERLQKIKPDFFIVGEIWNNSQPWLRGDEFDSVINYPLRTAIDHFASNPEKSVRFLEESLNQCLTQYARQTERVLINQMDSHDTIRLITKNDGNVDMTLLQFALILTLPGSACMYYGTEILLPGGKDPDCRRCMPWKEIEAGKFAEAHSFMRSLVRLRRKHAALRSDKFSFQYLSTDLSGKHRLVILRKFDEFSGETIDCIFNFGRLPFTLKGEFLPKEESILLSRNVDGNLLPPGAFIAIIK
ncbi:alpha-glycosidase [Treponema ruminis]|uniref:Glycosidase n=1 Tax=Treponema ruminis TaxID=744515 RepID=A0A7W8G9J2_9SPIR|nr:glycoside hydrolase family 13 protein [Treponema ruminis]MBB5226359.1 glycosidase [Treponema ruminis]QSI02736.1 alpha-glycosidase [Treponema ruminis]